MMYKRVRKEVAKHIFNRGCNILLLPCKCNDILVNNTEISFIFPFQISKDFSNKDSGQFEKLINSYIYYNCNYELGYYPHYFVAEQDFIDYKIDVIKHRRYCQNET